MEGADLRPLWEANRWQELPALALAGAEDALAPQVESWLAAHPPFSGPQWMCGQEAAFRALHLALAYALLDRRPPQATLRLLARRIAANPAYGMAQDNNHPVSEAAGLLICGMGLNDRRMALRGSRRLDNAIARLVAPDGSFAQASPAYHRLLLDTVAVAEWLRRRWGGPGPASLTLARLDSATRWLQPLVCPDTGAMPRIGHQDGSHLADIAGAGPDDARPSLERAARLFCGASAGWRDDRGCAAMGLPAPKQIMTARADWQSGGFLGRSSGRARAVLRRGPLRFRPGHADLLHLDLWDGPLNLLRDGGTGAYNPADRGWLDEFQGARAHNIVSFDREEPMPRLGPFLFARWPRTQELPHGGTVRDWRGRCHAREVFAMPRGFRIEDRLAGTFREALLRWRLAPGRWVLTENGVSSERARLTVTSNVALRFRLTQGRESLAYGEVSALPVLEVLAGRAARRLTTWIELPPDEAA
ncbi:heparinase II/III domain-containing protein [Roseococcus sp. YIM B11640]|uniref:heparinase II/III domain-containing protein n=1 Tax=Roseococcus sp. YIM B11640 TaxID=3133973 RepID=UPI003C7C67B1